VIVEDIATDPLWEGYRDVALSHGLRACWSTPIFDARRRVLGTFALYFRSPGRPAERHWRLIDMATQTAAIAISQQYERKALRDSEERLRLAVAGGNVGIWEWIEATNELLWSDQLRVMFGWPPQMGRPTLQASLDALHPADRDRVVTAFRAALSDRTEYDVEYRVIRPDGEPRWITSTGRAEYDTDGRAVRMLGVAIDITERKQAEDKIERLNRVYAVLSGINSLIVRVRDLQELFREACRLAVVAGKFRLAWIGILDREAGRVRVVASHGADREFLDAIDSAVRTDAVGRRGVVWRVMDAHAVISNDIERDAQVIFLKDATLARGIRAFAMLPLVVSGEVTGVLALYAGERGVFNEAEMNLLGELAGDIAFGLDHIRKEERINYLAYYDSLTGLANHTLFHERLTQFVHAAEQDKRKLALCVIDVDHFKNVNDALGRHTGDALLVQFAERLVRCVDDLAEVARLGADRFAIVLPSVHDETEVVRIIEGKVAACVGRPFQLVDTELHVAVKGGMALFPKDGADADTLFINAEAALKNAKAGGERYLFYTQEMNERIGEKLALESRLRRALENEEFVLHYQLKVDAQNHRIAGVEALIRWREHPQADLVLPGKFVPLLETTGMINEVGTWAIQRAIADHAYWRELGLAAPRIAVNVSAVQLRQRDFVDVVRNALARSAEPAAIDIEITESVIMTDVESNIDKLREIHRLGVNIAIDDFGTGYSSLGYLARLPVQVLKIDVTFIARMLNNPVAMTLVTTMISLAHSLGLTVVAEGVETEEQAAALRELGCDQLQGYLVRHPLPVERLVQLLQPKAVRGAHGG
jgi:diguanylate cyclase (GGDEF)-like protein/PAS domain S-box-containing protein